MDSGAPLVCPRCARDHDAGERFCVNCGLPLVFAQADAEAVEAVTPAHARARKVKPQYAEGEPVRVASARNQAEAEFIQALLLEEGVPSLIRRAAGFDVPDFLAAGPRELLVPAAGVSAAREVLLQADLLEQAPPYRPSPGRLALGLLAALALIALIVWVGLGASL